jgi:hypothetical protein
VVPKVPELAVRLLAFDRAVLPYPAGGLIAPAVGRHPRIADQSTPVLDDSSGQLEPDA